MRCFKLPEGIEYAELDDANRTEIDEIHKDIRKSSAGEPERKPWVDNITANLLSKLEPIYRARVKYMWELQVRDYQDYMRRHPEEDND